MNSFILCLGFMGVNATFSNISVILWQSVLLMVETGVPGENYRPAYLILDNCIIFYITLNVVIIS
jgi:hypothetical protein